MRNTLLLLVAFSLVGSMVSAEPELKGSPAELAAYLAGLPKMVGVAGESELKVPADRAALTLKVTTEHKLLQDALRANQDVRSKMIAALKERGVPSERVQASKFSSTPRRGILGDKAKSYRIENLVKVSVQDEKEFLAVAHVVDGLSDIQYLNVDFEHSDKEGLKKKALAQALDNASERKKIFEEHLGVKLLPKSFSQASGMQQPGLPFEYSKRYSVGAQGGSAPTSNADLTRAEGIEETGSLFGELVFTARVTVEYSVEQK